LSLHKGYSDDNNYGNNNILVLKYGAGKNKYFLQKSIGAKAYELEFHPAVYAQLSF
jgi:hypothetical protein